MDAGLGELGLEIEPAQARQADVEHQATRAVRRAALQKFLGRAERLDLQTDRTKQARERLAQRRIVVDHKHDRLRFGAHATPGIPAGKTMRNAEPRGSAGATVSWPL